MLVYQDNGSVSVLTEVRFTINRHEPLLAPLVPFVVTPEVSRHILDLKPALSKIPGLSIDAREVAILVNGTIWKSAFEIWSHERIAVATTNLNQSQIDKIKAGDKPHDLDEECSIAFDITTELLKRPGPLSEELWKRAEKTLGTQGATALVHYIGYYSYVSIMQNGFDVPLPNGESVG
ncbi:hypothetical protein SLS56_000891 [Neofusicoccum ribis]|uniref:Carboxymuconolactone decarboxylase-like domain-containing protein n=1 Tax=Neofusicoccum ribis TaxID=45134 RepID=A0ABR3TBS3_9PEZI